MHNQSPTNQSVLGTDVRGEILETERHLHSYERWFETAAVPDAEDHVADRIGSGSGVFQIDAGNDTWGSWVQLLGPDDTPADSGMLYFDLHVFMFTAAERNFPYFLQIGYGASGAAALSAGDYTEAIFQPASNLIDNGPIVIQSKRQAVDTKVWARCLCPGQDTATLDFFFGLHEYDE